MPAASSPPILLLDTSAAVPFVTVTHDDHDSVFHAINARDLGLAGHAAFETYSVLTRRPLPDRMSPETAREVLEDNFPHTRFLSAKAASALFGTLAGRRIAGGNVYDALVGATAVEHSLQLVTRDRRALDTYRELGADVVLL